MTTWPPLPPVAPAEYDRFLDRDNDEPVLAWLLALRRRFRTVNTLALDRADERADFPIDQLYVPPSVDWEQPGGDGGTRRGRTDQLELLVAARKRVLLLGTAGTGKSTFVQWLSWTLAERARNALHARIGVLIPLPIILRDLPITDDTDTWDALVGLLSAAPDWPAGLRERIDAMGAAGQLMMLVDGWDEVADTTLRRGLRAALLDGMARYPRSSFLLTSRPRGTAEVPLAEGATATDLVTARITPLSPQARAALTLRWHRWRTPDDADRLSSALLSAIDADPGMAFVAGNPLLLTLLALVHRRFGLLPRRRSELLGRVVDAVLVETGPALVAALSLSARRRLLQELALTMNRRRVWGASRADIADLDGTALDSSSGTDDDPVDQLQVGTTWSRERARQTISRHADRLVTAAGHPTDPDGVARALLDGTVRRSGLLVPRDHDRVAFAHLLLQDWLAASAFLDRLRAAWADPARADRAAGELRRWIFRSAGGTTVALLLDVLGDEQPALAARLGDELFAERAARRLEHLRLAEVYSDVWRLRGGDDGDAWPDWVVADATRVAELPPGAALSVPSPDIAAIYLCQRPDVGTLAPLLGSPQPAPAPIARTVFLVDTDVDRIPHGLQWRVVDEHGVCYTPEDGLLRPPHTRG